MIKINRINVAIVEDDDRYAKTLKSYLQRYEQDTGRKISTKRYDDGADLAEEYHAEFDIILMDIELKFMDGMSTAENIRKLDKEVIIIFITNMPQYAISGYKVDALDYILKPISYFALSQRIDRALERLENRDENKKYMMVPVKGGTRKIEISQLCYVEALNHELIFHMKNDTFMTRGTIKDFEETLIQYYFFRCNKGYLINLEYVDGVKNYDVFIGDDIIPVSRPRRKDFIDALNHYMSEVSK